MRIIGNRLLVEPMAPEKIGNFYLTERLKMSMELGLPRVWRVLAKGNGKKLRNGTVVPIECEVGDRVITHSYTEGPQNFPDGKAIITADQILAVLPK